MNVKALAQSAAVVIVILALVYRVPVAKKLILGA